MRLYFWVLRYFWNGDVSPAEAHWALQRYNHTLRIQTALQLREDALSYEDIAQLMKVTRERVRQMVEKGVRQARHRSSGVE